MNGPESGRDGESGGPPQGLFEAIDAHFGRYLERLAGGKAPWLVLAAALVSRVSREGSVCLDLHDAAGILREASAGGEAPVPPAPASWRELLLASPVVGTPGDYRPLIVDGRSRLYLYRYWEYETDLARFLADKKCVDLSPQERLRREGIDPERLRESLDRLFPAAGVRDGGEGGRRTDWQKIAALAIVTHGLTVVTGSPGTGKTATAARAIILLLEMFRGRRYRIALAAPTGKAAARLQEVIARTAAELRPDDGVLAALPERATTIHRLLGSLPGSPYFRHRRDNPLSVDAVVVDEASMVDLPLLAKLAQALPENSRLILLGDRNQLASVEAGAVLSDICGGGVLNVFSPQFAGFIGEMTGEAPGVPPPGAPGAFGDGLIELRTNYRFAEEGQISRLSKAVNRGAAREALNILKEGAGECRWVPLPSPADLPRRLKERFVDYFLEYRKAAEGGEPREAFARFDRFRILCALRRGPYGADALNSLLERMLRERGHLRTGGPWYPGRAVMVTANDYGLGLFNGDVGLLLPDPERKGELGTFFQGAGGEMRRFSPVRLPAHETVYALTVHKSQGSEFAEVLLILPDRDSPVLTRELIYTAITRARTGAEVWGNEEVFLRGVQRRIERSSGLRDSLWPGENAAGNPEPSFGGPFDSP